VVWGVACGDYQETIGVDMKNIKQLVVWSRAQSRSLKKAALKVQQTNISNIYFSRSEWIDYELLPRLEEILHASSSTQSTKRKKVSKI
jgi:hypothetical protein